MTIVQSNAKSCFNSTGLTRARVALCPSAPRQSAVRHGMAYPLDQDMKLTAKPTRLSYRILDA